MRKRTVYTEDFEGHDYEIDFEPVSDVLKARVGDKVVIGYLAYDNSSMDIDDLMGEGCGELISFHRDNRKNHYKGFEALGLDSEGAPDLAAVWYAHREEAQRRAHDRLLSNTPISDLLWTLQDQGREPVGEQLMSEFLDECIRGDLKEFDDWRDCDDFGVLRDNVVETVLTQMWSEAEYFPGNPDAVSLDCYSHSGEHWSLSGQGMQCQWDTARGAGVFVPSEDMGEELAKLEPNERKAKSRTYAQSFLDTYNNIIGGQVFGCVTQVFDEDGDEVDSDSCWGFIGSDYAEQALKEEFFDPMCSSVAKKYEEEIRTQCDRQLELEL